MYRLLIFYDMPMQTTIDRKNYRIYRKKLIQLGFYQLQESVYVKSIKSKDKHESIMKKLNSNISKDAIIRGILLTERSFDGIIKISGELSIVEKILSSKYRIIEF